MAEKAKTSIKIETKAIHNKKPKVKQNKNKAGE